MRLVGASKWFIRWPFVIEGMIVGLIGGAAAIGVLYAAKIAVLDPLSDRLSLLAAPETIDFGLLVVVLIGACAARGRDRERVHAPSLPPRLTRAALKAALAPRLPLFRDGAPAHDRVGRATPGYIRDSHTCIHAGAPLRAARPHRRPLAGRSPVVAPRKRARRRSSRRTARFGPRSWTRSSRTSSRRSRRTTSRTRRCAASCARSTTASRTTSAPRRRPSSEQSISGEFDGVGMSVEESPRGLLVLNVFEGSPAERSGITDGDIVTEVERAVDRRGVRRHRHRQDQGPARHVGGADRVRPGDRPPAHGRARAAAHRGARGRERAGGAGRQDARRGRAAHLHPGRPRRPARGDRRARRPTGQRASCSTCAATAAGS